MLDTASGVSETEIRRKKACAPPISSRVLFWNTRTCTTEAAKPLDFVADEFLDSDFLVFAVLAGVACKRGSAIDHPRQLGGIFESNCAYQRRFGLLLHLFQLPLQSSILIPQFLSFCRSALLHLTHFTTCLRLCSVHSRCQRRHFAPLSRTVHQPKHQ